MSPPSARLPSLQAPPAPGASSFLRLLLPLLLVLLATPAVRAQDPASCDHAVATARDLFLRGDFEEARTLLETCLEQKAFSDAEKPEVYKLMVRIYDADGLEEQVKQILAELLALVPNYQPDPDDPPSFIELVEQFKSEINQIPAAQFTSAPTTGEAPLNVRFDASTSLDADGTIASYAWDFGDGTAGSGMTVNHTFAEAGTYTVRLTVADDDGALSAATAAIAVTERPNVAPVARFAADPQTGEAPLEVAFDASESSDADGTVASYAWDFGDGDTDTGATTSHTYADAGTYEIRLTVADDDGATHAVTDAITVLEPPNQVPVARFDATPSSGQVPLTVAFDASASSDDDGTIASYSWSFGDGSTGDGATTTCTYEEAGAYEVRLTVADDEGATHEATATITATERPNVPPIARFAADPLTGEAPLTVRFDASASSDDDGTVTSYAWNFGDGSTGEGESTSHTFETAGAYEVQLTVADDGGATHALTVTLTVTERLNVAPVARLIARPTGGEAPVTVRFDASPSSDADGTITAYTWDFGDGSTDRGIRTSHAYLTAGTYDVTLTVNDDDGARASATERIQVTAPATTVTQRRRSGMRKWLYIGGGAVLAGTLGVVLGSGGGGGGDDVMPPPAPAGIPAPPVRPGGN